MMPSEAIRTWKQYSEYVEDLVHLTHEGYRFIMLEPEQLRLLDAEDSHIKSAQWKAERARREVDGGFSMLHAHSLLGLWGALECLVEDVFIHRLANDPTLLAAKEFGKIKVPAAAVAQGATATAEAVLFEAARANGTDLRGAPGRFERLLEFVGLGGFIPSQIAHALHRAQEVRNVWAHRGGIADRRFIEKCPDWGVGEGESVSLTFEQFGPLMHGIHMYVVLIVNRYRMAQGRTPVWAECAGYEGVLDGLKLDAETDTGGNGPEDAGPS